MNDRTPFESDAHDQLRTHIATLASRDIAPQVQRMEDRKKVDRKLLDLIVRQGWGGITIPAAYGGKGAGQLAKLILTEEISYVSGALGAALQASLLGTAKLLHYGCEEQQRRWLPQIADGTVLTSIAVTEPGSGSHVLGMAATARRDGSDYVLTGTKTHVGNAHVAHVHGVVARTGPGARGLSAFLVPAGSPGLHLAPHQPALGLHGFSCGELHFDEVRIPVANRVGEEGQGLDIAYSSSVLYGRPNLTAVALGLHRRILDESVAYARQTHRYGRPLADVATVRQRIGEIASRLSTARLAAYHAASLLDDPNRQQSCDAELIQAKYLNCEAVRESAQQAMMIHGAAGLQGDNIIQRLLRDAWHTWAPAGTGDIQIHRLAEHALGTSQSAWSMTHKAVLAGR